MKDKRVRKLTKGSRKSVGREGLPRPVPQGAWEYIQFPGQGIWINKTKVSVSISPTTPNLLIFVLSHAMEPPMNTDDQTEEFCLPTHCCLCPSPDYLPPAARSLFHRDLLYVLTNSAHNGSLSMCRFLAQDLSNVFQASPHRYLDRTPQVLRQDLTVPWGYLNRVHLLPLHLSTWKVFCFFFLSVNSYASRSAQVSPPEGSLPWSPHAHTLSKIYVLSSVVSKLSYHGT